MEYLYYDVSLRYSGRYGSADTKLRWFFGERVAARDEQEAASLTRDTLREAMPFAKVVSAFVDRADVPLGPDYPARIGLVFD